VHNLHFDGIVAFIKEYKDIELKVFTIFYFGFGHALIFIKISINVNLMMQILIEVFLVGSVSQNAFFPVLQPCFFPRIFIVQIFGELPL